MAIRTISNAGGNWSATGSWIEGAVPTTSDDVVSTATSGTVTLTASANCRSMDLSEGGGFAGAGFVLNVGASTPGPSNVALKLSASTGTWTPGTINFNSTSTTQQTVTSGGKSFLSLTFNGVAGSWLLSDSFTSTGTIGLTNGTLNTNNLNHSFAVLAISAGTKTLTLGSSTITLTSGGSALNNSNPASLTITANTATIQSAVASVTFTLGTTNWGGATVAMTGSGVASLTGNFSNASITRIATAIKTDTLSVSSTGAAIVNLTLQGNSVTNRLLVQSSVVGTQRSLAVTGTVTISNVDFMDMAFTGASAPLTGTSIGDALGNSGITVDTPQSNYWVGGTGNASTLARWASSSGGVGGTGRVPLPQDIAVFDEGSGFGGPAFSLDMPRSGKDIDATTRVSSYGLSATTVTIIYGSLKVPITPTANWAFGITFAGRGSHTIQLHGRTFSQAVIINAPGGTYTLTDAIATGSTTTLTAGTLDLAGFNATFNTFVSTASSARSLINSSATTATINLSNSGANVLWNVTASLTFGANIPIVISNTSATSAASFTGGGKTYLSLSYVVSGSTRGLLITDSNTFGTLNFSDASNARTLTLAAGTTQTVTNWNVSGTAGKLMSVVSGAPGTRANVSAASGNVVSDYVNLQDIAAIGGATFYAGSHSTDSGNNIGWNWSDVVSGIDRSVLTSGSLTNSTLTGVV